MSGGSTQNADDIDFSDIEAKYNVQFDDGLDNIIVVDGVPRIDESRREKLLTKIAREFSRRGISVKPDTMFMPWDTTEGKSKGFLFVEFRNVEDANLAISAMHDHQFDSKHTFKVNRFTDIEKYPDFDETYIEPETEEYTPKEHLRAWLADPQGRDQYVTYRGDEVAIHWHGKPSQSEVAHKPEWKDFLYVAWSPLGTYIATLHRQGVRLWGGSSWKPVQRFAHPMVKLIDFSACENYLVTWSNEPIVVPEGAVQGPQYFSPDDEGNNIAVWDIKSGDLLRTFSTSNESESSTPKKQMPWPALKWSPDDKFVGRLTAGEMISIYEAPGMHLYEKKSLKIEGVVDFEWCPQGDKEREDGTRSSRRTRENILAYWTPEFANQPARVTLMAFPSRTILRQKNLFNVTECKLYWQNQGDFLCVKVDRHTKTKKSIFCNLEIFRLREKDYPVEVVELKDTVLDFSWEPKGERFAIVSSSDPNLGNPGPGITIKTDVSFYQLDRAKNDFKLLRALPNRTSNAIRWSPRGRHVVLATVGSSSKSELEFWDLDFNTDDAKGKDSSSGDWGSGVQLIGTADHYGVTDVEWDPSGRYLATSASAWTHTLENGYAIWDFRGQEIVKQIQDRFKQFIWRPRPPTLLGKEKQKQIRRTLKEYSRTFDEEDAAEESNVSAELIALRKRLVDEWNAWRTLRKKEVGEKGDSRKSEEDKEEIEVWVDECSHFMSGSTTLWATASKEWVIPSKPKPGRKPKKDLAPVVNGQDKDEDLEKGRRIQNRAAQRAFRERKQSQLAELQARISSYEQGEIERNVALQKIAKRLKDENDKLVQENNALKERLAKMEEQQTEQSNDANEKKRWREDSPPGQCRPVRKRTRTSATPPAQAEVPSPAATLVATPDASEITPPQQAYTVPSELDQTGPNDILDFSSTIKDVNIDSAFPHFHCGFCTDQTPCLCRELAINELNQSTTQDLYKATSFTDPSVPIEEPTINSGEPSVSHNCDSSILDNLPAYQPPVPLPRNKSVKAFSKVIFPVYPPSEDSESGKPSTSATCSGDPSNCAACNDDPFGKAFCSAIEETVKTSAACSNCPVRYLDGPLDYGACGSSSGGACHTDSVACGGCPSSSTPTGTTVIQYEPDPPQDFIPTNQAWRQIKAHPNAQFADLSLLATVVASRSKCTGPRIILSPPPEHLSNLHSSDRSNKYNEEAPRLVPQEILLECGRRRIREVHSDSVRDVLRLLDRGFGAGGR
ncbi:hypothetical protein EST38_g1094 [Candolleomyces aberdarensis]|uniref:Eukaryotic translation initiation factor 3 subunit B n=1 Tax=Candolleomyces aberdarensis TaxID=2316362 RepID=A0A4Q2E0E3_9AGAR|nr:hypothetical protein EST38_g1094 [Candolleomyces aberdarensis]